MKDFILAIILGLSSPILSAGVANTESFSASMSLDAIADYHNGINDTTIRKLPG